MLLNIAVQYHWGIKTPGIAAGGTFFGSIIKHHTEACAIVGVLPRSEEDALNDID